MLKFPIIGAEKSSTRRGWETIYTFEDSAQFGAEGGIEIHETEAEAIAAGLAAYPNGQIACEQSEQLFPALASRNERSSPEMASRAGSVLGDGGFPAIEQLLASGALNGSALGEELERLLFVADEAHSLAASVLTQAEDHAGGSRAPRTAAEMHDYVQRSGFVGTFERDPQAGDRS